MKIIYEYSHLGGAEILKVRYPAIEKEINEPITKVTVQLLKISNEKTIVGEKYFYPKDINLH